MQIHDPDKDFEEFKQAMREGRPHRSRPTPRPRRTPSGPPKTINPLAKMGRLLPLAIMLAIILFALRSWLA